MAEARERLVEYLVNEIALNGDLGASPEDVCSYTKKYYDSIVADKQPHETSFAATYSIDGLDLANGALTLLASHPDLVHRQVSQYEDTDNRTFDTYEAAQGLYTALHTRRIYAHAARCFSTVCGRSKQSSNLSDAEYHLLSIIAASREDGTLESDLVRAVGQAKPCVDRQISDLEAMGYVKKCIVADATHVTRWYHFKFGESLLSPLKDDLACPTTSIEAANLLHNRLPAPPLITTASISSRLPLLMDEYGFSTSEGSASQFASKVFLSIADVPKPDFNEADAVAPESSPTNEPEASASAQRDGTLNIQEPPHRARSSIPIKAVDSDSEYHSKSPSPVGKKIKKQLRKKPKGRPRLFARGLEKFWRDMFVLARAQANPGVSYLGNAGAMSDPAGLTLYSNRPADFDDTLIKAIQLGLPAPVRPQDVAISWVEKMSKFLKRNENGLYISPFGEQVNNWKRNRPKSQILVFRTPRMGQVDLSSTHRVFDVRFITSSVAHTFHHRRFYPTIPSERPLYFSTAEDTGPNPNVDHPRDAGVASSVESSAGATFEYDPSSPSLVRRLIFASSISPVTPRSGKRKASTTITTPAKRVHTRDVMNGLTIGSTRGSDPLLESPAIVDENLMPQDRCTPNPYGLPPPLTTRAARRKLQSTQQRLSPPADPTTLQARQHFLSDKRDQVHGLQQRTYSQSHKSTSDQGYAFIGDSSEAPSARTAFGDENMEVDDGAKISDADEEFRPQLPTRRVREGGRGGALSVLRRNILLEIVESCSGAIPSNKTCPAAEFQRRYEVAGHFDVVDGKTLKAAIKSLCDAGRLKQIKFGSRNQRGSMVTRSILAKPSISTIDPLIQRLQSQIIASDPQDYVPFELTGRHQGGNIGRSQGHVPPLGLNFRTDISMAPLRFNSNAEGVPYADGIQGARAATSRASMQKIAWMHSEGSRPLPSSLEEIVREDQRSHKDHSEEDDPALSRFEWEIDGVLMWELRTFNHFQVDYLFHNFINHVTDEQSDPGFEQKLPLRFVKLFWYDAWGNDIPYPFLSTEPRPSEPEWEPNREASTPSVIIPSRRAPKPRRRDPLSSVTPITDRYTNPSSPSPKRKIVRKRRAPLLTANRQPKRQRVITNPRARRADIEYITDEKGNLMDTSQSGHTRVQLKRQRGMQWLRAMNEDDIYRIAVTVVVVRTLAGGLEKYIEWPLVMRMFPQEDEQFVKDRWKTLANRYRRDVNGLTESLQERYLLAYEKGLVPGVDFEDLQGEGTDWEGICEWAVANLDKFNSKRVEELPADREVLLQGKEFAFEEFKGMRELLGYNVNATGPRKEEAVGATPFAVAVPVTRDPHGTLMRLPAEEEEKDPDQSLARSWVQAIVQTSTADFHVDMIGAKLMQLGETTERSESLVDQALKGLQRDRVIVRNREGHLRAGMLEGGWEVSLKFYEHFEQKRMITGKILRRAAEFKLRVLDRALGGGGEGRYVIAKEESGLVEDGDMVAILNLMAMQRVRLRIGHDVPKSRYGLDWQTKGYQTRLLDKNVLGFGVVLERGRENGAEIGYVTGDPMAGRRLPVPRGRIDQEKGRIPMWFNVMGKLLQDNWEMVLSAVVGLVSVRAGIGRVELRRTLGFGASAWDLDLVLEWLEGSGFIKRTETGGGWITEGWWWMVLAERSWTA